MLHNKIFNKIQSIDSVELTYAPSMGLPEADSEFTVKVINLPAQPTPQDLVDFKKSHIQAMALAKAKRDYKANKSNPKKFLAERKNTRTDQGYTADPYSPANLFCARLALSLVDQNASHPREQFWKLLYPELKHVILGNRDSDWPNYGEALLAGNDLINYRKLALMAQDRKVLNYLLNQDGAVKEGMIPDCFKAYPHYRSLSQDEISAVKKFNHEEDYWENAQSNQLGANAFEFFTNLKNVLDRFRSGRSGNEHLASEMSDEGVKAISPYLEYMNRPTFIKSLKRLRTMLPSHAMKLRAHVDYLNGFATLMKNYHHSCFEQAHSEIGKALADQNLVEHLIELSLEESNNVTWNNQIIGHDSCPPTDLDQTVMESCLNSIHDKKMLFEWIELESARGTPLPVKTVAKRFRELSSTMTAVEIFNFIYEHFPRGEDIIFADQQGREESAAYSDSFFINELFNNGFQAGQLKTIKDCRFALKLHENSGVRGKHATLERVIDLVGETDRYLQKENFNEIREIFIEVIGDQEISEDRLFHLSKRVNFDFDEAVLLSLFDSIRLDDFERMAKCYFRRSLVQNHQFIHLMTGFETDRIDENPDKYLIPLSARIASLLSRMIRKKSLILFSEFLSMLQGPYQGNFHLPQLAHFLYGFNSEMQSEMGLMFCMKALERRTVKDNHFAYALGLTLNLLIDSFSGSFIKHETDFIPTMTHDCFCAVNNLLQMSKSSIKDPKDPIDRIKNQFIDQLNELIKTLNPVQFSILLSSIEPTYRKGFIKLFLYEIAPPPVAMELSQWLDCVKTVGPKTLRFIAECMPIRVKTRDDLMSLASSLGVQDLAPYIRIDLQFQIVSVDEWLDLYKSLGPYSKALLDSPWLQEIILFQPSILEPIKTLLHFLPEADFKFMIDQGRLDRVFDQIKTVPDLEKILSVILVGENPSLENLKITAVLKACQHIYYDQLIDLVNKTDNMQRKRSLVYSIFFLFKKVSNYSFVTLSHDHISERINALDEGLGTAAIDGVTMAMNSLSLNPVAHDIKTNCVKFFEGLEDVDVLVHLWLSVNQNIADPEVRASLIHGFMTAMKYSHSIISFLFRMRNKLNGQSITTIFPSSAHFKEFFDFRKKNDRNIIYSMLTRSELIEFYSQDYPNIHRVQNISHDIDDIGARQSLLLYELHRALPEMTGYNLSRIIDSDQNIGLETFPSKTFPLLADLLARYKAIYELLVKESPYVVSFDSTGAKQLQHLALTDLQGWKAFFNSSALKSSQSMLFQAWEIARVYDSDARVIKLEVAIKNLRARGNDGLGLFVPLFTSQRITTQELTPDTKTRILQACNATADSLNAIRPNQKASSLGADL